MKAASRLIWKRVFIPEFRNLVVIEAANIMLDGVIAEELKKILVCPSIGSDEKNDLVVDCKPCV